MAQKSEFYTIFDFQNKPIRLYHQVAEHIKKRHPEIKDPVRFVESVLKECLFITEDELPDTVIYHKPVRKPLLHVVYVYTPAMRIKSAHVTDKVKGGDTLWMADTNKIKKLLKSK